MPLTLRPGGSEASETREKGTPSTFLKIGPRSAIRNPHLTFSLHAIRMVMNLSQFFTIFHNFSQLRIAVSFGHPACHIVPNVNVELQ